MSIKYFCDNCDAALPSSNTLIGATEITLTGPHGTNLVSLSIRYGVPKLDQGNLCNKCIFKAVAKILEMELPE